jgi:hypothetical protein
MNIRGMGCALYIWCALSIHQKECRKSFGCKLYIGARYLPENTVVMETIGFYTCEFRGYHGWDYEGYRFLGRDAV